MQIIDSRDFRKQAVWNEDFSERIYFWSRLKSFPQKILGLWIGEGVGVAAAPPPGDTIAATEVILNPS
jgi:hypothetical protein